MKPVRENKIPVKDIEVEIRKSRGKNVRIKVERDTANVVLFVPEGKRAFAVKFAYSKYDWIAAHRAEAFLRAERNRVPENRLRIFGKDYKTVPCSGGEAKISGESVYLPVLSGENGLARSAEKFKRKILSAYLEERVKYYSALTGLVPAGWKLRTRRSRWGVCNGAKRVLTFNTRLIERPEACADYVVLHEIAHLAYPDHGKDFKKFLTAYMPDWKNRKNLLMG